SARSLSPILASRDLNLMKKMFNLIKSVVGPSAKPSQNETPQTADFAELGLIDRICKAVKEEGYESPTPIQVAAVPHVLAGTDLLGCAQTGTGKTAAF